MISEEDKQDSNEDFTRRTSSVRRLKLNLPDAPYDPRPSIAIEYDESECVSDTSFASESCTSTFARKSRCAAPERLAETNVCNLTVLSCMHA
jgi:hypothetical protein